MKDKTDIINNFKKKLKIKLTKQKNNILECKYYTKDVKK
jgi:hypothetical protein